MSGAEDEATFRAAVDLFDAGRYLAAHELFEELWEGTEGTDSDFYKGLIQAAIALHHFESGNLDGAAKLHASLRGLLAKYLPRHGDVDLVRFLADFQFAFRPVSERTSGARVPLPGDPPRLKR